MLETEGVTRQTLGQNHLPVLAIENEFCSALVALQGAQVLAFELKHQQGLKPLLWRSNLNEYEIGKAIRGGIPLCFPWFGAHPSSQLYPAHGFARNLPWECIAIEANDHGHQLVFELSDSAATRKFWDFAFSLRMIINLGAKLQLELQVKNLDERDFEFGFAWHSYFPTQIHTTEIEGLQDETYIDQLRQNQQFQQTEKSICFDSETDRIYPSTQGKFVLKDGRNDAIYIQTTAKSAVIWNPWIEKAKKLKDVDDAAWRDFVCIECGQLAVQTVCLKAGEQVQFQLKISLLSQ